MKSTTYLEGLDDVHSVSLLLIAVIGTERLRGLVVCRGLRSVKRPPLELLAPRAVLTSNPEKARSSVEVDFESLLRSA